MKLRLFHHTDGARIAYREAGTGPPLVFLHSAGLSYREWEPLVEELGDRFRLVLPDLPLHGDSEDRPRHPYTPQWLIEVVSAFVHDAGGPRPIVAGHDAGALLALRAVMSGAMTPGKLVLMPSGLHRRTPRARKERALLGLARAGSLPGLDRALTHVAHAAFRPASAEKLTVTGNPAARDLIRHAMKDVPGNANRARAWARLAARWDHDPGEVLDGYRAVACPTLLLWADQDPLHPVEIAAEAEDLLPDAQLRVLDRTGFLIAYDDAVGVAREIAAWA